MTGVLDTALRAVGGSLALSIVAKATVILAIALLGALILGRFRAAVRHLMIAAGFAAIVLLPVASLLGPALPIEIAIELNAPAAVTPASTFDATPFEPRTVTGREPWGTFGTRPATPLSGISMSTTFVTIWAVGALLSLAPVAAALWQMRRWRRICEPWPVGVALAQRLAHDAGITRHIDVRVRASLPGPVAYGARRPVIVLPADVGEWANDDVQRALIHELEHVRRGDWWTQAAARIVCALYWFHPLAWMARRRLILEAERACDDAVLSRSEATAYAEQLVKLAQHLSARTRQPMPAMAHHRDLRVRIDAVLDSAKSRGPARTASVAVTMVAAVIVGVGVAPFRTAAREYRPNDIARDISLEPARHLVPTPDTSEKRAIVDAAVVRPVARSAPHRVVRAQGQPGAVDRPRFAEATITPCGGASGGRGGGPGSAGPPAAGTIGMGCRSLAEMIRRSHGYGEHSGVPVEGGAPWVDSDEYQITARAEGNPSMSVMLGPMLQTLLEDRFKLRLRRDTRNVSGYALTVVDGGHKLTEAACEPPRRPPIPNLPPLDKPCAWSLVTSVRGPNGTAFAKWVSVEEFAGLLSNVLSRPVVDKTGISVRFDARLEFAPEGTWVQNAINDPRFVKNPNPGAPTAPVIFTAIEEQLGLRLEPATVPTDVFVVEHVERPE